jgi:hypothetical protein
MILTNNMCQQIIVKTIMLKEERAYAKAAYPFPELKSAADPLSCPLGAAGLVSPST